MKEVIKKALIGGLVFSFVTISVFIIYAAIGSSWTNPTALEVGSGSRLTAMAWNQLLANFNNLNNKLQLTSFFESSELPLVSGITTTAHGLGGTPKLWKAIIRCKVADLGYSPGDEIDVTSGGFYNWYYFFTSVDTTNITYGQGGGFTAARKDNAGFTNASITASSWKLILRAWK